MLELDELLLELDELLLELELLDELLLELGPQFPELPPPSVLVQPLFPEPPPHAEIASARRDAAARAANRILSMKPS